MQENSNEGIQLIGKQTLEDSQSRSGFYYRLTLFLNTLFPALGPPKYKIVYSSEESGKCKCMLFLLGDILEVNEYSLTEEEALENVSNYALQIVQKFRELAFSPFDFGSLQVIEKATRLSEEKHQSTLINIDGAFESFALNKGLSHALTQEASQCSSKKKNYSLMIQEYHSRHNETISEPVYETKCDGRRQTYNASLNFNGTTFVTGKSFFTAAEAKENVAKQAWEHIRTSNATKSASSIDQVVALVSVKKKTFPGARPPKRNFSSLNPTKYANIINDFCQKNRIPYPDFQYKPYLSRHVCFVEMDGQYFESSPNPLKNDSKEEICEKIYDYLNVKGLLSAKSRIGRSFGDRTVPGRKHENFSRVVEHDALLRPDYPLFK